MGRVICFAAGLAFAGAAMAQEPPPIAVYAALPAVEHVELSPSGERLALVTVAGEQRAALMTDLQTGTLIGGVRVGDVKLRDLDWIGEDTVFATTSTTQSMPLLGVSKTEFFLGQLYDIPGRELVQVFGDNRGMVPVMLGDPQIRATPNGLSLFVPGIRLEDGKANLFRVDPRTGRGRLAVDMDPQTQTVVLDAAGQVLAKSEYDGQKRWSLHLADRDPRFLREAWAVDAPLDQPSLIGLGRRDRTVLVHAARSDLGDEPRPGGDIFEIDLDSGDWTPLSIDADTGLLIFHPRNDLLVGIGRKDEDGYRYTFFDAAAERAWSAIERAFAAKAPQLVSTSDDFRQAVVLTGGAADSGVYHMIDLDLRQSKVVGEAYPALTPEHVGEVRPIKYTAGDGLEIHGYLTLPPGVTDPKALPLVVLAHGGPASHDEGGFDWWAQAMASRGYAVLQANFRGSTGYGLAFMEAGYGEWGRKMQTDLSDGVRHLAGQGMIDPAKVCIVGASYGGYAALAGVTLDLGVYRCAVSVSGVSDLRRMVLSQANRGGRRDNAGVRYWNRFMGADRLGDRDLDAISPAHLAERADAPILLLHGRDDTVVPLDQSRTMAAALRRADKPHQLIELTGEDHWLSRAETRRRMLEETVAFVTTHNPAH